MYLVFVPNTCAYFLTVCSVSVLCVLINSSAMLFDYCCSCYVLKLGVVLLLFIYVYFDYLVYFIVLFEFCNSFSICVKNISIILIGIALNCKLC